MFKGIKRWAGLGALVAALTLNLSGCASQNLAAYQTQQPQLDLRDYFNGRVMAYGMFQDRNGQVVKRFTVTIDGSWQGDVGTLDEHFNYSDGSTERRVWTLQRAADGSYTGQAGDVVGQASGQIAGNAFKWHYTLRLPVGDAVYEVQFEDWMYLIDQRVMLNRATMRKFGLTLGEVTLTFIKP